MLWGQQHTKEIFYFVNGEGMSLLLSSLSTYYINDLNKSVLFITHDVEEAIYLSDKVYVLSERPAQIKDTLNIEFERPRNREIIISSKFLEYKKRILDALI